MGSEEETSKIAAAITFKKGDIMVARSRKKEKQNREARWEYKQTRRKKKNKKIIFYHLIENQQKNILSIDENQMDGGLGGIKTSGSSLINRLRMNSALYPK